MSYLKSPSIGAMFNRGHLTRLATRIRDAVTKIMPQDPARAKWLSMRCTPRALARGRVLRYLHSWPEKYRNRHMRRAAYYGATHGKRTVVAVRRHGRVTGAGSYAEASPNQLLQLRRKLRVKAP